MFADIKHNAITLPIIHALKNADSMKERLIEIIKFPTDDPNNRDELKHILTRTGSLDYAFNRAKYYVQNRCKSFFFAYFHIRSRLNQCGPDIETILHFIIETDTLIRLV